MDLDGLTNRVHEALVAQAARLELDAGRLEIKALLNWGGFVNRSFWASDGQRQYHVKLTVDSEVRQGLERWRAIHSLLEERYHAPRLVAWLQVAGTEFVGPVCEWAEGGVPSCLEGALLEEVLNVVAALHRDGELALSLISAGDQPATCAETYLRIYHRRFVEDLRSIQEKPPPFVSAEVLRWMWRETEALEAQVQRSAAFAEPVASPIHGDLWINNLIMVEEGRWYILDWDDLSLGDAMLDCSMLLGPSREDLRPATARVEETAIALGGTEAERFQLYARASLLDWTIDPLADYVDSQSEPEFGELIRRANEQVHRAALELYRKLYAA